MHARNTAKNKTAETSRMIVDTVDNTNNLQRQITLALRSRKMAGWLFGKRHYSTTSESFGRSRVK